MQPGQPLLHYRLVEKIGEGGMGVVWRAVDTSLNRNVAIKVLPDLLSRDPERLARFEREAKLLASLNHPNIAVIHGLHQAPAPAPVGTVRFLAMELVEGENLAQRLAQGRLPVDEALAIAAQIAGALEAAHARGVMHRDLKPANVVLTPGGKPKVLDFGLAKMVEPAAAASSGARTGDLSLSPTVTSLGTAAGVILGTAAYMSPEQARGKPLDRRTDLWSFGCVLYECLTGVQLFKVKTVSDSLAAILCQEPDWSLLPADTPPLVRHVVRRCLTRDREKRLQDAGDARLELELARDDPELRALGLAEPAARLRSGASVLRWLPWSVAAAAIVIAGFFALSHEGPGQPQAAPPRRLTIPVPGPTQFGDLQASPPAISPDGRQVVFGVTAADGESELWHRPLDAFEARLLPNTKGSEYAFWSPDSRHVGFFRGGRLRRIEIATGRSQAIGGEGSYFSRGGSWNARGQIIFSPNSNAGIHLIEASGGASREITTLDDSIPDCSHRWPLFLPDGEHFVFTLWTNDVQAQEAHGGVYVASVAGEAPPRRVLPDASSVGFAPPGHLLVVRGDNLIAVPFDARARQVTGEAAVVATGVLRNRANGHSAFTVSTEGTLIYAGGQAFLPAELVWYDRSGESSPGPLEPAPYTSLRLAPGGRRAAVGIPGATGDSGIWIIDLVRGVRTRLAQMKATTDHACWSADGEQILYASQERGSLDFYLRRADGSGGTEPVYVNESDKILYDWSRDGQHLVYWPMASGSGTQDLHLLSLETGRTSPFLAGESTYASGRFSPDSLWLAYASDDSGRMEVFVQGLVKAEDGSLRAGARWQVSTAGGDRPRWRDDGREVAYVDLQGRVMVVSLEPRDGKLLLEPPVELFQVEGMIVAMDATADHRRFLLATRDEVQSEPLHVILNWEAGI